MKRGPTSWRWACAACGYWHYSHLLDGARHDRSSHRDLSDNLRITNMCPSAPPWHLLIAGIAMHWIRAHQTLHRDRCEPFGKLGSEYPHHRRGVRAKRGRLQRHGAITEDARSVSSKRSRAGKVPHFRPLTSYLASSRFQRSLLSQAEKGVL